MHKILNKDTDSEVSDPSINKAMKHEIIIRVYKTALVTCNYDKNKNKEIIKQALLKCSID